MPIINASLYVALINAQEENHADDCEQDRMHIRPVAEAGVTWWMKFIEPASLDKTREGVMRGLLCID